MPIIVFYLVMGTSLSMPFCYNPENLFERKREKNPQPFLVLATSLLSLLPLGRNDESQ